MKIIVQFDDKSTRIDRGDGYIYLDFGNFQFPDKNWFDFTFLVIAEWTASLCIMIKNNETSCFLPFMDGNWSTQLTKNNESCTFEFGKLDYYDKIFESSENPKFDISFKDFCTELIRVNKETIEYARSNSIDSEYFRTMESWYSKLVQF